MVRVMVALLTLPCVWAMDDMQDVRVYWSADLLGVTSPVTATFNTSRADSLVSDAFAFIGLEAPAAAVPSAATRDAATPVEDGTKHPAVGTAAAGAAFDASVTMQMHLFLRAFDYALGDLLGTMPPWVNVQTTGTRDDASRDIPPWCVHVTSACTVVLSSLASTRSKPLGSFLTYTHAQSNRCIYTQAHICAQSLMHTLVCRCKHTIVPG